jgi:peroxiredoxin
VQELPAFQQVYEKYSGQIDMLAVAVDEQGDPASFFTNKGYTFTLASDVDGAPAYNVKGIPHTVVIDAKGNKVQEFTSGISSAELDQAIQSALGAS